MEMQRGQTSTSKTHTRTISLRAKQPRVRECALLACAGKSRQRVEGATRSTASHVDSHLTWTQIFCADGLTCDGSLLCCLSKAANLQFFVHAIHHIASHVDV